MKKMSTEVSESKELQEQMSALKSKLQKFQTAADRCSELELIIASQKSNSSINS